MLKRTYRKSQEKSIKKKRNKEKVKGPYRENRIHFVSRPNVVYIFTWRNQTKHQRIMRKLFSEFKEFAVKGNMIDIAIGVIIGTAFNKVVDVLVKEVFLPPLSFLTDGVNWTNKKWVIREAVTADGVTYPEEIAIGYGKFIEASVDFLIIGFTVFLVVKVMNRIRNKSEDPKDQTEVTPKNIQLLDTMVQKMDKQISLLEKMAKKD